MTIKDLEQYAHMKKESALLRSRIEKLRDSGEGLVFDTVKGSRRAVPYSERVIVIKGTDERRCVARNKLLRILDAREKRLDELLARIEEFIDTIDRSDIRQIIEYRYIQGLPWKTAARKVYGFPCEDRARKAVVRFFEEI